MKKLLSLLLLILMSLGLSACDEQTELDELNCDLTPTHVDCQEEEIPDANCETDPSNELCDTDPVLDCETDPDNELCETDPVLDCETDPDNELCDTDPVLDCETDPDNELCETDPVLDCNTDPDNELCETDPVLDCNTDPDNELCETDPVLDCETDPDNELCETDPVLDCNTDPDNELCIVETPATFLDIYYINDLHGALLPDGDEIGMAYIANFLITKKEENPDNVIIVSGGDILQGSALSNYYMGYSTINLMNNMYFDAFTIGNHEFDWGIEAVTAYADGNVENGEAVFPLLGANIFIEGTSQSPDFIEPYTIVERSGLKIGIIGTMGYGLESSIATSKIEGYEFADPVPLIKSYTYHLRTVEEVDMVLVVSHDTGAINSSLAYLTGDYKVDAIFNAHSHSTYAETHLGLPVIQSGAIGRNVGYIRFNLDEGIVTSFTVENLDSSDSILFSTPDPTVQGLLDVYQLETDELFNEPILVAGEYLSTYDLTRWIARVMRITSNSDIAFHNTGGTRTSISNGEMINRGLLYEVWPFDNFIKTVWLTGSEVKSFMTNSSTLYDTEISYFDNDTYYKVATNDYVFDKDYYPFIYGEHPVNTGLLLREIAADELELQQLIYSSFLENNTILSTSLVPVVDPPVFNSRR